MPSNVLIVDDHTLLRDGLSLLLAAESRFQVCGMLERGADIVPFLEGNDVDIVILDLMLEDVNALGLLPELVGRLDMTVIVLSGRDDPSDYARAFRLGARAVVSKSDQAEEIIAALDRVSEGETYRSPVVQKLLGETVAGLDLSPRQMAVLHFLAEGMSNKEIAFRLNIRMPTVSFHMSRLREKLGIASNRQIIPHAIRAKLL